MNTLSIYHAFEQGLEINLFGVESKNIYAANSLQAQNELQQKNKELEIRMDNIIQEAKSNYEAYIAKRKTMTEQTHTHEKSHSTVHTPSVEDVKKVFKNRIENLPLANGGESLFRSTSAKQSVLTAIEHCKTIEEIVAMTRQSNFSRNKGLTKVFAECLAESFSYNPTGLTSKNDRVLSGILRSTHVHELKKKLALECPEPGVHIAKQVSK
jgi:hypothetical protein